MPAHDCLNLDHLIRIYFWEDRRGGKINHLVRWSKATNALSDGGHGIGGLKHRNEALLAKWGWRFMKEPHSFWRKVIVSIHGASSFDWYSFGKSGSSLRSPWKNIHT